MSKIYLASSWRNDLQPSVLLELREAGHEVYDFRHPRPGDTGFSWGDISAEWLGWQPREFVDALESPVAEHGFANDWDAMEWADTGVLLLPCGRSAHIEAGYFVGHPEKRLHILIPSLPEPELMYKMADGIHLDTTSLIASLS